MQVSLSKRGMTSFDATRLNSKEEQQMLRAISELDLSYNSIAFVKGMQSLGRLTELNLSHNCLETLDRLPLALRKLDVSHNNLTMLTGMASLVQLQTINCSHNALVNLQGIPPSTTLRVLDASHNKLNSCRGLEHCTGMVEVNISANLIADVGQLTFLRSIHSLRVLDVADNPLTHRSVKLTQELRAQLPRIEVIRTGNISSTSGKGATTWVSPNRQSNNRSTTSAPSRGASVGRGAANNASVVVAPNGWVGVNRRLEESTSGRSLAAGTPDASVIHPASAVANDADQTFLMGEPVAKDRPCLHCDDLKVEIAALKAQLANEQAAKARLHDELSSARLEIEKLRRRAQQTSEATGVEPPRQPFVPPVTAKPIGAPSARMSLSAAVAALAESRSRLQQQGGVNANASATASGQLGITRSANLHTPNGSSRMAASTLDTSSRRRPSPQQPLGYQAMASQGMSLGADRKPSAADQRHRPSSADARYRAPSASLRDALLGHIAPLPSLQRSASADGSRPRSADTSMASTHKSVTFGPNQYFSPPSYR